MTVFLCRYRYEYLSSSMTCATHSTGENDTEKILLDFAKVSFSPIHYIFVTVLHFEETINTIK
ncbi:hypothetical protein CS544_04305 [Porphyromonas gingivalis]|nr:hypothetical protein CS544_04305 [Porphyromonas gingivalis]